MAALLRIGAAACGCYASSQSLQHRCPDLKKAAERGNCVKAVYTELHRSHDPQFFLVRGVVQRTTEQPERADRLLAGLKAGKHDLIAPTIFGQGPRARVHSPEYLRFLEEAWDAWTALGDAGP